MDSQSPEIHQVLFALDLEKISTKILKSQLSSAHKYQFKFQDSGWSTIENKIDSYWIKKIGNMTFKVEFSLEEWILSSWYTFFIFTITEK